MKARVKNLQRSATIRGVILAVRPQAWEHANAARRGEKKGRRGYCHDGEVLIKLLGELEKKRRGERKCKAYQFPERGGGFLKKCNDQEGVA